MELYLEFLKKAKVKKEIIAALEAQIENPSDVFKLDDLLTQHKDHTKEVFYATEKAKIEEEYEEANKESRYLNTIKPLQNKILKLADFTKEEIEGKNIKEVIELLGDKIEAIKADKTIKGNEETLEELKQWKEKYQTIKDAEEEKDRLRDNEIQKIRSEEKAKVEAFQVDKIYSDAFDKNREIFDKENKLPLYKRTMKRDLQDQYIITIEGKVLAKDGKTAAVWEDGETLITDLSHAMELWADKNDAVKRSNGDEDDEGGKPKPKNQQKFGEKVIDQSGAAALGDFFDS